MILNFMKNKYIFILFFILSFTYDIFSQNHFHEIYDTCFYSNHLHNLSKGGNQKRYKYIKSLIDTSNEISLITESVDWLGLYKNIIVEKKGKSDSIIYIVSHYDKISNNIVTTINTIFNGGADILLSHIYLSDGYYDNGTGVVLNLSLLNHLKDKPTKYTYRFLFTAQEEYGLRGVRRHISGLTKEEWKRVYFAINIDMVGAKDSKGISITENVSDPILISIADSIGSTHDIKTHKNTLPKGALADFYSFKGQSFIKDFSISFMVNVLGAFVPQKSYFTVKKEAKPVINFTDNFKFSASEHISPISPIGFGKIHSFRDNQNSVDIHNLYTYHFFLIQFFNAIE
ncbi:MAG: M28 family peptidase [Bacteroidales bacterium]|mgnify:CR=1 FL=1|nr:M28 family peptidase [Bacteroidales bacterium]